MNALPEFSDILSFVRTAHNLRDRMAESLAEIVCDLLNENEPLLKATRDGCEITVSERGGGHSFEISVAPLVEA